MLAFSCSTCASMDEDMALLTQAPAIFSAPETDSGAARRKAAKKKMCDNDMGVP